jgi:3-hydroxyacyl-CoA dehydrogenase
MLVASGSEAVMGGGVMGEAVAELGAKGDGEMGK